MLVVVVQVDADQEDRAQDGRRAEPVAHVLGLGEGRPLRDRDGLGVRRLLAVEGRRRRHRRHRHCRPQEPGRHGHL